MNAANVVSLSTPHSVTGARAPHPAVVDPIRVRFGAFELDEPNALLLRDGAAVSLAPRPFGLLCALARRPGVLLTKHSLLDDVWGHQFVTDSVLKTAISEVRTVLDDDPRQPRFIETVSRRGYRFIARTTPIPNVIAFPGTTPVRAIAAHEEPSLGPRAEARASTGSPREGVCGDKQHTAPSAAPKASPSWAETGCPLLQPVFPTLEEVCYAHQLRLMLRLRLLRAGAPAPFPC